MSRVACTILALLAAADAVGAQAVPNPSYPTDVPPATIATMPPLVSPGPANLQGWYAVCVLQGGGRAKTGCGVGLWYWSAKTSKLVLHHDPNVLYPSTNVPGQTIYFYFGERDALVAAQVLGGRASP